MHSAASMFGCLPGSIRQKLQGAMLVDSAHEDQGRYEPRATRAPVNRLPPAIRTVPCAAVPVAGQVGGVRFLLHRSDPRRDAAPGFTVEQAATLAGLELQTKSFVVAAGCDAWAKSAAEAHAEGNFGNRPLIVLTARRAFAVGAPQAGEELKAFHEI